VNDCIHKEFESNLNGFLSETNMTPADFKEHEKSIVLAAFLACHCLSHSLMNGGKKAEAVATTKLSQAHTAMISQSEKVKKEYFRLTGEQPKFGVQTRWGSGAEQQAQIKRNTLEKEMQLGEYAKEEGIAKASLAKVRAILEDPLQRFEIEVELIAIEYCLLLFIVCCYQLESSQANSPIAYVPLLRIHDAARRNAEGFVDMTPQIVSDATKALDKVKAGGLYVSAMKDVSIVKREMGICNLRIEVLDGLIEAAEAAA
jgi:hypothetical protein